MKRIFPRLKETGKKGKAVTLFLPFIFLLVVIYAIAVIAIVMGLLALSLTVLG